MLLKDAVVLITGAAGELGTVLASTAVDHGAGVAMLDRDVEALESSASALTRQGATVHPVSVELGDEESIHEAVAQVERRFGRIDVLVNNAGIVRHAAIEDTTQADWDATMAINVRAAFVLAQAVEPTMTAHGGGAIVNVTSIASRVANPNKSVYCISKAALRSLTEQIAVEWGPKQIRCNAVAIGETTWTMKGLQRAPDDDPVARARETSPLRRPITKQDVANAVIFLASGLSGYINGVELLVDGGKALTLLTRRPQLQAASV
jgi:NAD(P)-dependent dehydrogenase (short-subunit alcohol dehydrogenase family)